MKRPVDPRNPELKHQDLVARFEVRRIESLDEIEGIYYELVHPPTGARYVHISRADGENSFGVAFKTIPRDGTGVAHILEHTVLCGSRRYPVRDPFFSMIKRSLNTFMNAFTASDWTMYPFSTQNRRDFYNLMSVYLDAAFFPKIDALSFKQEGHRLAFEQGRLVFKGVVFNEMKGAMSSPDQVMGRALMTALYPDTTYRFNSGGDPAQIPSLTHVQLKAFHQHHYHPTNAYFYSYGDLPLAEHLAAVDAQVLVHFDKIDPDTQVPSQPRWSVPKHYRQAYPVASQEADVRQHQACLAWLMAPIEDAFEVFVFALLEQILLGNPASPLRKALLEAGIGTALSDGTGFDPDNRDTMFACGLKGVGADDGPRVAALVMDCFSGLVENGIETGLIEAAIHQVEFHHREVTNTPYPYGLKLLLGFVGGWLHGADVIDRLRIDAHLGRLRQEMREGGFFEDRIQRWFLENPHRVSFLLEPDPQLEARNRQQEAQTLADIAAALDAAAEAQIREDEARLEALQQRQEDISVLPTLTRGDVPETVQQVVPDNGVTRSAASLTRYQQPTSGITYLTGLAGAGRLAAELLPLVPFFCYALPKIGTRRRGYVEIVRRIDAHTGGLGFSAAARTPVGAGGQSLPLIFVGAKSLQRNIGEMFDIVGELLSEGDFGDQERLGSLLAEYRAGLETAVIHAGHRLAISLAARHLSQSSALNEIWSGIRQLQTIKSYDRNDADAMGSLSRLLARIGARLFASQNFKAALVGDAAGLAAAQTGFEQAMTRLAGDGGDGFGPPAVTVAPDTPALFEGWHTSTAVSFVAQAFSAVPIDHPDAAGLALLAKIMRSAYLHREIRERGGAYGGFALYNPESALFVMASYRDPHIVQTLIAFDGARRFVCEGRFSHQDVDEAVLQVCADIDKPFPPGEAARKAFVRSVIGLSDELRLVFKTRVLAARHEALTAVAQRYFGREEISGSVAVISGENQLQAANTKLSERQLALHKI